MTGPRTLAWVLAAWAPHSDTMKDEVTDKVIIWGLSDPRFQDKSKPKKDNIMQTQWTIQIRADFAADPGKRAAFTAAVTKSAVYLQAKLTLLGGFIPSREPPVAVWNDDFFLTSEELSLLPDELGKVVTENDVGEEAQVSDELIEAARAMSQKTDRR